MYCWFYSPYPRFLSGLLLVYMLSLLSLFFQFYLQKYLSGPAPPKAGRAGGRKKAA